MSTADEEHPEDQLAEALAAFDERLAAGIETSIEDTEVAIEPALLSDWTHLTAFLSLVERAWPRDDAKVDDTTGPTRSWRTNSATDRQPEHGAADDEGRFGRFQILRTLGQGGFGIVFLAWDPTLRRHVALKVPQPEALVTPEARKRFQREALAAAGLDHPHIVPVYENGSVGAVSYIAAAYVDGPTLSAWLRQQTEDVPARDAAEVVAKLARAVHHAHQRRVLHRDLKPSNVLLQGPLVASDRRLAGDHFRPLVELEPRITDFSLAKLADGLGPDTRSGIPFGSPPYMAPEQAEGKLTAIGPATDVYGLGCILYELLTGAPPFVGESQLDTLRQITALDPLPAGKVRRDLGVALDSIVMKCLQKEPARRYTTALELAEDLDRFLAGEPTRARPSGRWEILYRRIRRQPALFVVLATVATSVLLLLGGRHWYEARLNSDRLLAQRQERVARARDQAHQTHLRYSKSIRQADELIRKFQGKNAQQILESLRPEPGQDDLREFAWHHLMRRCQTERRTLMGHHGDVYYVAFSPRGDLLASAGKDGTVRIWNTATWDLIRKIIASPQEVNVAAFAPDGEALATADDEGKLKLWETATGKLVWERQAHGNDAVIAIFTRDGKTIITGGRTEGKIRFWDRDGRDRGSLVAERLVLESAVLSPDGSTMATGGTHGIKLWDGQSRTLRAVLPRSAGAQGIAFSHDGTKLAAAYESDQVVRVWDVSRRSLDHEDTGHSDAVFGVGFSADDKTIISSGDDGTIRFWDTRTGQPRGVHLGHAGRVWNLTMSPDGRTLVSAGRDGTVKVWDCEGSHEYTALPYTSPAVAGFENDGRILLTLDIEDSASIGRWDTRSGLLVKRTPLGMVGRLHYADFSNDGQTVVILDSDGVVAEWDTTTGRRQHVVAPGTGKVNFLKISSNDRYLAIVVAERLPALVIWDRQNRRSINLPRDHVEAIEFAASGELVLICKNGELVWWDPASGHTRTLSLGSRNNRLLTKFSPDGRLVAFVETGSRSIQLRSAQTLEFVRAFMPEPAEVRSVIFSPDGKTLVVLRVDRTLKLFDTATGEELIRFDGFARTIYWAKFAPDGMTLVTASQSGPGGLGGLLLWRTAGNDP